METYRTFLDEIARKLHYEPNRLNLYRLMNGKLHVAEGDNALFEYLKPDWGHSSRLDPYFIMFDERRIAQFSLYQFPSCCAFCVSTGAYVEEQYRRRGINTIANRLRQWIAKEAGYSALICTDVANNVAERKTLAKNGFKDIYELDNKRTGNRVLISVKEL